MPRRSASRVNPIMMGGEPVMSLDSKYGRELLADAVEEAIVDWNDVAAALELTGDQRKILECKAAGMPRASMAGHLGWRPAMVDTVRLGLEAKISRAPLRGKRAEFVQIRLRGRSCAPFHMERITGVERIELDRLDEQNFAGVMRRECPQPVEVKTLASKNVFSTGTSRSVDMNRKSFELDIKTLGQDGTFVGALSVYDFVDYGGDVTDPGCFTKTLQESGGKVPMLYQHDMARPIGIMELNDGPAALQAKGYLNMDLPDAKIAHSTMRFNMKHRVKTGLSMGYITVRDAMKNGVRHLQEVKLLEGSVVTLAANQLCAVTDVKRAQLLTEEDELAVINYVREYFGRKPYSLQDYRDLKRVKQFVAEAFADARRM